MLSANVLAHFVSHTGLSREKAKKAKDDARREEDDEDDEDDEEALEAMDSTGATSTGFTLTKVHPRGAALTTSLSICTNAY